MNLPNKITVARILLIPVMIVFFFVPFPYHDVVAAGIFVLAAFTDFLDGYIARKNDLVTDLGKFLDPIADKVLVVTALLLILEQGTIPAIYGSVGVAVIVAREFMVSAFRLIAATKGKVIAADMTGKIKTVVQDICIPFLMVTTLIELWKPIQYIGWGLFALSVLLTVWSGISYLVKNRGVMSAEK